MKSRTDETLKYIQFLARHFETQDVNALTLAILYDLGFTASSDGFFYLRQAIELQHAHAASGLTKTIYPQIFRAHRSDDSWEPVDKAIHRSIETARYTGNAELWDLFFPPSQNKKSVCPPNKEFIAGISCIIELWQCCKEAAYDRAI